MTQALPHDSLLLKTARGTGWVIGWRMATRLLGLASTLTLVRLLLPEDFGLVALGVSFAQSIEALSVLGVEEAVIREKAPEREVYDTAFTLAVLRGAVTGAIILALAIPAGDFFAEPRLSVILAALAAGTLIEGFENIGTVQFRRDFAFGKEFQLWILPRLIGIVLTVSVAFAFRSYWALVVGMLSQRCLRVAFGYSCTVPTPLQPAGLARAGGVLDLDLGAERGRTDARAQRQHPDRAHAQPDAGGHLRDRRRGRGAADDRAGGANVPGRVLRVRRGPQHRADAGGNLPAHHRHHGPADPAGGDRHIPHCRPAGEAGVRHAVGGEHAAGAGAGAGGNGDGVRPCEFGAVSRARTAAREFPVTATALLLRVALLIVLIARMGLLGAAIAAAIAIACEQVLYVAMTMRHFAVHPSRLLRHTWRGLLATTAMAVVLYDAGLGWHIATVGDGPLALQLLRDVTAGVAVYVAVLLAAWVAAGRPPGAETDFLALMRRLTGGVAGTLRAGGA